MIKLVLTDLDDTLIPFGNPGVSDFARAAIHTLLDAGVHFGPVSGRPPQAMEWMFGDDPACFATGAFSNGQMIYVDGEARRLYEVRRDLMERLVEEIDELDDVLLTVADVEDSSKNAFVTFHPERGKKAPPDFPFAKDTRTELGEGPFLKNYICFTTDSQDYVTFVRDRLNARIPELEFFRPSSTIPCLDFTPWGHGKGAAVHDLVEELGITLDEVCVFGDTENDVPMLEAATYSVVVANASAEAKAAANYGIGDCREESVAKALLEIAAASLRGALPAFLRQSSS